MLHGGGEGKGGCRNLELQWELGPASSGQPCAKSLPRGHAGTPRHPQPLAVPPHPGSGAHASAGNRARVTSMATMYSATRPLMPAKRVMSMLQLLETKHTLRQSSNCQIEADLKLWRHHGGFRSVHKGLNFCLGTSLGRLEV